MADSSDPSLPALLSTAGKIDSICDQFEHAWRAARNPRIEEYLASGDAEERTALLRALLEVELELVQSAGSQPDVESYLLRFPLHEDVVRAVLGEASASYPPSADTALTENTAAVLTPDVATSRVGAAESASASAPLKSIDRINRFEVLQVLGEGAFGTVYRARDPRLDREVAIKLPRESALATSEDRTRFLNEAKIAATLDHPNICPVFEAGEIDGHPYIVMSLIEGKTLADFIKSGKPIAPRSAVAAVRRIALALEEAHGQKILHRDLKPSNIMVNRRGEPVVMDFGLARLTRPGDARLTHSGQIMGSPAYMSPEQARGATDDIGPASDIYSLGVILYELLCGQRPYVGTVTEVLGQILHVEPPPPSAHKPDLDPALEAICLQAMAKEPEQRYGSMHDFAAVLQEYLKSQSAIATQTPSATQDVTLTGAATPRTEAPRRRRASRLFATIAVLLLIAAVAFAAIYRIQTDRGVLVVEVHDPAVETLLREDGLVIYDQASGRRYTIRAEGSQAVRAGTYQLAEKQPFRLTILDDAGLEASASQFTLRRREEVRVRVTLEEPPLPMDPLGVAKAPPPSADRRAAEWVLKKGGSVDVLLGGNTKTLRPGDPLPDAEFRVDSIFDMPVNTVTDDDLAFLQNLKALRRLHLREQRALTDAVASHLSGSGELTALNLQYSRFGDLGLARLAQAPNAQHLEILEVGGTRVSDAGIETLRRLTRLTKLDLGQTQVTGAGLPHLAGLRLQFLYLNDRPIGDVGVANLAQLPDLRLMELDLGRTGVADAGLAHLSGFDQLQYLRLDGNPITDDGLKHLHGLTRLRQLNLLDTQVSAEGVKQLNAALPNCEIAANARTTEPPVKRSDVAQTLPASPLDQLDPQSISPADRFPWQPEELVAVYGDHRGTHWGAIHALALSPDGRLLASAGGDGVIGLWNPDTLESRGMLTGHEGAVNWITFTLAGQLLSAGADGTIRLWDMNARRETSGHAGPPDAVGPFAFSPKRRFSGHSGAVRCVAVTPDGAQALSCGDDATIRLWSLETGQELRKFDKHAAAVWKVCLTADGKRVLSGSDDRTMRFWDLETGEDVVQFENEHPGPYQYGATPFRAIALSPDGARAACGYSEDRHHFATMRLFDTTTGKEVFQSRIVTNDGHGMDGIGHPGSQVFSPDGELLLSGAWSPGDGNALLLWDAKTGELKRTLGRQATGATAVLFSHDGKRVFSGTRLGRIRAWSADTGEDLAPPAGHESFVASVALSPDGRSLLTGGEDLSVRRWDALSGKQQIYRAAEPSASYSAPWTARFAPHGETALFHGGEYTIDQAELWDVKAWRALREFHKECKESIGSVAFSPDGRQVLAGLNDGLLLWDLSQADPPRRLAGHGGSCTSVAFFPEGLRAATGGQDKFVRLWDLLESQELKRIGPFSGTTRCLVSLNGRWVAVASVGDGSMRLYDSHLERETPFPGAVGRPVAGGFAAVFTPDSRALAVANNEGQIVIWNLATITKRHEFKLPGAVHDLAFDPTGRYLATANHNGTVYLLRLPPSVEDDKAITNSVGMKLVPIPAGEFLMGSPATETGRVPDEGPQRRVTIPQPFHMGMYEVTQAEFEKVMGYNPSHFVGDNLPAGWIRWAEAKEFCRRLSDLPAERAAGRAYRLPLEAEWEYACRAGTTTAFHFGDSLSADQANFAGAHGRTTPVGSFAPNAWKLFDMHGNAQEWCEDIYADGRNGRVIRGGGWNQESSQCRSAFRSLATSTPRRDLVGFRIVMVSNIGPLPDFDRLAAEWVLSVRGTTTVVHAGKASEIQPGGSIPTEAFSVITVDLTRCERVGDTVLGRLRGLRELRELSLRETNVSDAGLDHLKELRSLHRLNLEGTRVTPAGLRALQEALPACEIIPKPPSRRTTQSLP